MEYIIGGVVLLVLIILFSSFVTVKQGFVAVTTIFGKFHRIITPGLSLKIPLFEIIYREVSIQNKSLEMEFQAVTQDQANVYFKSLMLYAVLNQQEETIKNVVYKFASNAEFMQTLTRTIEGNIRSFVATKKQSEILSLRGEIVQYVKFEMDNILESRGYHLIDVQINDITFDKVIMESMSKVVASNNLKAAAENEGQALLITKTKAAEAEGNAIKISAEAEKTAAQLRGQGVALFREEVARGMSLAAKEMKEADINAEVMLFSMWTEAIKNFAELGKGNVIFLDGSPEGMQKQMTQIMGITQLKQEKN